MRQMLNESELLRWQSSLALFSNIKGSRRRRLPLMFEKSAKLDCHKSTVRQKYVTSTKNSPPFSCSSTKVAEAYGGIGYPLPHAPRVSKKAISVRSCCKTRKDFKSFAMTVDSKIN